MRFLLLILLLALAGCNTVSDISFDGFTGKGTEVKVEPLLDCVNMSEDVFVDKTRVITVFVKGNALNGTSDYEQNLTVVDHVFNHTVQKTVCKKIGIKVGSIEKEYNKEICTKCVDKLVCFNTAEGSLNRAEEFKCVCRSGEESCYELPI